jgi:hypothetical protein
MDDPSQTPSADPTDLDVTSGRLRTIPVNVVGSEDEARAAWEALQAAVKARGEDGSIEEEALDAGGAGDAASKDPAAA